MNTDIQIADALQVIRKEAQTLDTVEVYKKCLSCVDYTTLNATDTLQRGRAFAEKVNNFSAQYPDAPNVAAICVYPALVKAVRDVLKVPGVKIAAVGAGFPAAQTYADVKVQECAEAAAQGADEIDIVISLCYFLAEDYKTTFDEVAHIKRALGKTHLKVILETGALTLAQVRTASIGSIEAGADFIKTSTGKLEPAATPEAAIVMCSVIKEYYDKTGKKVGFKPAGGIVTAEDAVLYYAIVRHILGEAWLTPTFFRIGASRLANNLLSKITGKTEQYF
ncbi:deoxyribose-phosphate aldolase [Bacteroidia bacterium]|nr:deoxyribose-phosphate aldolase [Bacteroidia bacterium]